MTGSAIHSRVDEPTKIKQEAILSEGGVLRSVSLSSDTLELTGVEDLVETLSDGKRCLLDYKKGSPNRNIHGEWQVKDNDAIQLGAYALLLKENGVEVDSAGILFINRESLKTPGPPHKWEFVEVRVTNSDIRICEFRALRRKDSKAQHKLPPAL